MLAKVPGLVTTSTLQQVGGNKKEAEEQAVREYKPGT